MSSREHKLELVRPRITEDGDALVMTKSTRVIFELFVKASMPIGLDDSFKDIANQCLLLGCVEVTFDLGAGDISIIRNYVCISNDKVH